MLPSIGPIAACRRWLYGELVKFCRLARCGPVAAVQWTEITPGMQAFHRSKVEGGIAPTSLRGRLKLPLGARIIGVVPAREAPLSEAEPIQLSPRSGAGLSSTVTFAHSAIASTVFFTRKEFTEILDLYGRKVAAGEWRAYAIDFGREKAVFCVFRRSSEVPLYRIEKNPRLARRQGAYSVIAATGLVLKRGHDLSRVLGVLEKSIRLAAV